MAITMWPRRILMQLFGGISMDKLIEKLTSGRFILTVAVSYTLCKMALTSMISPAEFLTIAGVVVYAYFTKKENGNG